VCRIGEFVFFAGKCFVTGYGFPVCRGDNAFPLYRRVAGDGFSRGIGTLWRIATVLNRAK
jgi:hypothetical protein